MPVPQVTIVANMLDLLGAIMPNATLTMQLAGYGSQVPRISGTGLVAQTAPLAIVAGNTGVIMKVIWGNDAITPANTYYTFTVTDDQGNVVQLNAYQFAGAGTFDLSSTALFNPPPPSILAVNPVLLNPAGTALQVINGPITINGNLIVNGTINGGGSISTVGFSATPVFNGTLSSSFKLTLTGNVTSSTAVNMAGRLLVAMRIVQDATGNWTFVWPATMRGGGVVNPAPLSRSVQLFSLDTDNSMDAIGPIMYS